MVRMNDSVEHKHSSRPCKVSIKWTRHLITSCILKRDRVHLYLAFVLGYNQGAVFGRKGL